MSSVLRTDAPTVTLHWIARQLGRETYGNVRLIKFVTLLIEEQGFPPPLPMLLSGKLCRSVTPQSVWRRNGVLAWFDDVLPPANAAQVDAAARRAAASEMDQSAGSLRMVRGARA